MLRHIEQKPAIGIVAGAVSAIATRVEHFLTDDHTMKIVSGVGTLAGAVVAVISCIVWCIKFKREFKKHNPS